MKIRVPKVVVFAVVVAVALGVLHALGGRRSTAALSGIVADPAQGLIAAAYIGCWFVTILVTPVVVLTWMLLGADRRLRPRKSS